MRVTVKGGESLDPRQSYVFAANHQSIYDIPILFASLPLQLRIVAKASLGSIPFLGWHLRRTGHLLVNRKNPGADIVEKMRRLVSEAHSLIVFPEGTRSVDGRLGRFKKGPFLVAVDAGLPGGAGERDRQPARHGQRPADGPPGRRPGDHPRADSRPRASDGMSVVAFAERVTAGGRARRGGSRDAIS